MGAVVDNLTVPLQQIKNYLKVDDIMYTTLNAATVVGSPTISVANAIAIDIQAKYLTLFKESLEISSIDYGLNQVTFTSNVANVHSIGTPVMGNPDDELIQDLFDGTKEALDEFLNNPFDDGTGVIIPKKVKQAALSRTARDYERRISGLDETDTEDLGRTRFSKEDGINSDIYMFRLNPGL